MRSEPARVPRVNRAGPLAPAAVAGFLEGGADRHVIVVGEAAAGWRGPRVFVVEGERNLEAMREAIGDISGRVAEVEP